ncbi:unnamed protein product [Schistocephalus solidus]|uniref:Reverse transcriptase domain-containing protein n=1 Tax=Schistocephalus solidus TaxID=70667 RepID=A0A183TJ91_SCHSO|nr:unnamed protein product [Schistocephalus solidus]
MPFSRLIQMWAQWLTGPLVLGTAAIMHDLAGPDDVSDCTSPRVKIHPHREVFENIYFKLVNRDGLWKIMQKFRCPERFTHMVRQLHEGMITRVTDKGTVSEAFAVTNGVKRGCVLAPTLFSLMFSAMLTDAYREERPEKRIVYQMDSRLLNQRRMHFRSRVSTATIHELLFADDCALNTTTEEEMQRSMDLFAAACDNFGLRINTEKTVVMHQPPLNVIYTAAHINFNGAQLKSVDTFT